MDSFCVCARGPPNQVLEMPMVLYNLFKQPNINWENFLKQIVEVGVLKIQENARERLLTCY